MDSRETGEKTVSETTSRSESIASEIESNKNDFYQSRLIRCLKKTDLTKNDPKHRGKAKKGLKGSKKSSKESQNPIACKVNEKAASNKANEKATCSKVPNKVGDKAKVSKVGGKATTGKVTNKVGEKIKVSKESDKATCNKDGQNAITGKIIEKTAISKVSEKVKLGISKVRERARTRKANGWPSPEKESQEAASSPQGRKMLWRRPSPGNGDLDERTDRSVSVLLQMDNSEARSILSQRNTSETVLNESVDVHPTTTSAWFPGSISDIDASSRESPMAHMLFGPTPSRMDQSEQFLNSVDNTTSSRVDWLGNIDVILPARNDLSHVDTVIQGLANRGVLRHISGPQLSQPYPYIPFGDFNDASNHPVLRPVRGRMHLHQVFASGGTYNRGNVNDNVLSNNRTPYLHEPPVLDMELIPSFQSAIDTSDSEIARDAAEQARAATGEGSRDSLEANSFKSAGPHVKLIRSARGSLDLTNSMANIGENDADGVTHPILRTSYADVDLPSAAARRYEAEGNVVTVIASSSLPSWETLSPVEMEVMPTLRTPRYAGATLSSVVEVASDAEAAHGVATSTTVATSTSVATEVTSRMFYETETESEPGVSTIGAMRRFLPHRTYWPSRASTSTARDDLDTSSSWSGSELTYDPQAAERRDSSDSSVESDCSANEPSTSISEHTGTRRKGTQCTRLNKGKSAKTDKHSRINCVWSLSEFDLIYARSTEDHLDRRPARESASPRHSWKETGLTYILHPNDTNFGHINSSSAHLIPYPRTQVELRQIFVGSDKKSDVPPAPPDARRGGDYDMEISDSLRVFVSDSDMTIDSALKSSSESSGSSSDSSTKDPRERRHVHVKHTGSTRLEDSLGVPAGFNVCNQAPCDLEIQEVQDELVKMVTRSKNYVPPMDLALGEWRSIIQVLGMDEPQSVLRVLCRLSRMTSKRYCDLVKFYRCGLYDYLLVLLRKCTNINLIQNLALKLIAELSCLPECRLKILKSPWLILHCMNCLTNEAVKPHFHEYASKILSSVIKDPILQKLLLRDFDLITIALRRVNTATDPDIRCNCMTILVRVAKTEESAKQIINNENFMLDVVIAMVDSKYGKIQQLGLGMLVLLTRFEIGLEFQEKVEAAGVAQLMVDVLGRENMSLHAHLVISIMCNIANTEYGLNVLRYSGAVKYLVDYIDKEGREDLLGCGLDIVIKLSVSKSGRELLVEYQCPGRLVRYLKQEEDVTLERTCIAIANISQNLEALCIIVNLEPAEDLIRLIYEDGNSSQLKFAASRALYELAGRDEKMCQQIAELHLTEVFHHIIWSGFAHIPTLSTISDIIQIISQYPDLKPFMIDDESIACFLDIIQGHCRMSGAREENLENEERLRISGMQCLRCYMTDPLCRKLFSNASGIYVLRGNLRSSSIIIRQATAVFIELAARDPSLATEMVLSGFIEIFRGDRPMMSACPAWKKALDQIYDHHLSSKFAYLHRLDVSDITVDGFYVTATNKGKIEVLENLLHDRKCPLETIYVCSFSNEPLNMNRSLHVIMRPKWQPYIKKESYPAALAKLATRGIAKTWRRKVSLLYGEQTPKQSCEKSLEISDKDVAGNQTYGQETNGKNMRVSSLSKRVDGRNRKYQENSINSSSFVDLPDLSQVNNDDLNASLQKYGVCPSDAKLASYLENLCAELAEKVSEEYQANSQNVFIVDKGVMKVAEILGKFVVKQLCGNTDNKANLVNFFNVGVWELKKRDEMNVIPLGHLKAGLFLERALLYKVLADRIGLPCTLIRGEYGITYNELCIPGPNTTCSQAWNTMHPNFVVDLMHAVGNLYFIESREAYFYCHPIK